MKTITIILFLMLLFACSEKRKNTFSNQSENISKNIKDSLAFELCAMYGLDQGIRDREIFSLLGGISRDIDTHSFNKLIVFVKKHGYPNKQLIGEKYWKYECVSMAATAIMLHNPNKLVNEKEFFNLFLEEVNKGNMSRSFLADVLDKYYWSKSRGQRVVYGSQFGTPCIDTKTETNTARKKIGLAPLEDSEFKDCQ